MLQKNDIMTSPTYEKNAGNNIYSDCLLITSQQMNIFRDCGSIDCKILPSSFWHLMKLSMNSSVIEAIFLTVQLFTISNLWNNFQTFVVLTCMKSCRVWTCSNHATVTCKLKSITALQKRNECIPVSNTTEYTTKMNIQRVV